MNLKCNFSSLVKGFGVGLLFFHLLQTPNSCEPGSVLGGIRNTKGYRGSGWSVVCGEKKLPTIL